MEIFKTNFYLTFLITLLTSFIFLFLYYKKKLFFLNYTYVQSSKDLVKMINKIISNNIQLIGLDTEYFKGNFYSGKLCLFQISFIHNNKTEVYIIDPLKISKIDIKENLKIIFSNRDIEKVIHSCENDLEWIYEDYDILLYNIFDTQEFYHKLGYTNKKVGLEEILNKLFTVNIDKQTKKRFQTSNWLNRPLSREQLNYATLDTYYLINIRIQICSNSDEKMINNIKNEIEERNNKRLQNKSKIERSQQKALNYLIANLVQCESHILEKVKEIFLEIIKLTDNYCKENNYNTDSILSIKCIYIISTKILDRNEFIFTINKYTSGNYSLHEKFYDTVFLYLNNNAPIDTNFDKLNKTSKSKEDILSNYICKKPIYENCKMIAPDDEMLCYCDKKKMSWYIDRKLAYIISEDPPVFKLVFEPNKRGCIDSGDIKSEFYITSRKNCCVVCGAEENYMRFHVVPFVYRQYFPNSLKAHRSHDIVLLCFNCRERALKLYDKKKVLISNKYNIPLNIISDSKKDIENLQQIIRCANNLIKHKQMPIDKKKDFQEEILNFLTDNKDSGRYNHFFNYLSESSFICEDLTDEILTKIMSYKIQTSGEIKKSEHGKLIVNSISNIEEFIKEWRKYFLDVLEPKHLPDSWNVDHEIIRTFGELSKFNKLDKENTNI